MAHHLHLLVASDILSRNFVDPFIPPKASVTSGTGTTAKASSTGTAAGSASTNGAERVVVSSGLLTLLGGVVMLMM